MGALNDAMNDFYSSDAAHLMSLGSLFVNDHLDSIGAAGSHYFGFITGEKKLKLFDFLINTLSPDTSIEFYEGGTYTLGSDNPYFTMNRSRPRFAEPFAETKDDVVISAAGERIRHGEVFSTSKKDAAQFGVGVGMILKENTVYYFHVRNNDVSTHDYDFTTIIGIPHA